MPRRQPTLADTLTSAAAGAFAGTLATFVMDKSLEAVFHVTGNDRHTEPQVLHQGSARSKANVQEDLEGEPSTMKLTTRLSSALFDRPATRREREVGGYFFHYAYGAFAGAVYGALAPHWPTITRGAGLPYGTAVWLAADEGMISLLRLGRTPDKTPASAHIASLIGHWAFGLALHVLRRVLPK